ncbi:hypothetical protein [Streptomyces virginiae]|uniref:Uncharacterized protein n=1 Tax=Streptomyces virginiae TaxID=1961 RepID=A0ABZ1TE07_STRVG|nr:hypothetical protein [Streptomyces virginiae]
MCIRITYTTRPICEPYDSATQVITLPAALSPAGAHLVVRALLTELAVIQPRIGARCHCGAAIRLLPRVPQQRRSGQVTHHGA